MDYIELATPEAREQHGEMVKLARKRYLRWPLIVLNDELIHHGSLDYYSLTAEIGMRLKELKEQRP